MAEAISGAGLTAVGFSTATSLIAFTSRSAPFGFGGNANSDLTAAETPRITSPKPSVLLVVGDRTGNDEVSYPDIDMHLQPLPDGTRRFIHKDGTPY